jgi:hypothetical protein
MNLVQCTARARARAHTHAHTHTHTHTYEKTQNISIMSWNCLSVGNAQFDDVVYLLGWLVNRRGTMNNIEQ